MLTLLLATLLPLAQLEADQLDLADWNGQEVEVRGFCHQGTNGQWFVSSTPHVPSCCLSHPEKWLIVSGLSGEPKVGRVVAMHGTFADGILHNAVERKRSSFPWGYLVLVAGLATFYYAKRVTNKGRA